MASSNSKPSPRISINLDVGGMDAIMGSLYKKESNTSFYNSPSSDMHRAAANNGSGGMRRSKSGNSFTSPSSYHKAREPSPNYCNEPHSTGGIKPYHGLMRRRRRTADNMLSASMLSQLSNLSSSQTQGNNDHEDPPGNKLHRHAPDVRPPIEPNGSSSLKEAIENLSRVSSTSSFGSMHFQTNNLDSKLGCAMDKKIQNYRQNRRRSMESDTCSLPSQSSRTILEGGDGSLLDTSLRSNASRMRRCKSSDSVMSVLRNGGGYASSSQQTVAQQNDKASRRVSWSHLHSISLIDLDKSPDVTRALNVEWKEIGLPSMPFGDGTSSKNGGVIKSKSGGPATQALEQRNTPSPALAHSVFAKSKKTSGSQHQDQRRHSVDSKSSGSQQDQRRPSVNSKSSGSQQDQRRPSVNSKSSGSHHSSPASSGGQKRDSFYAEKLEQLHQLQQSVDSISEKEAEDPILQKMHTQQAQQKLPTTRVIALPWTDSRGIQGEYTGEVNSALQPHGNGTFKTSENETTLYSSTWQNGTLLSAQIPLEGRISDYVTQIPLEGKISDYVKNNTMHEQQQQQGNCSYQKRGSASSHESLSSKEYMKRGSLSSHESISQFKSCFSRKTSIELAGQMGASSATLLAPSPPSSGSRKKLVSLPKKKERFLSSSMPQSQVPSPPNSGSSSGTRKRVVPKERFLSNSMPQSSPSYEEELRGHSGVDNAPAATSSGRATRPLSRSNPQAESSAPSSNPQGDDIEDEANSPVSTRSSVSQTSLPGYHLGHPAKDRSHMIIPPNTPEGLALALRNAYALKALDFAFILRSTGVWTYAIVADRPFSEDGPSIRFVLDSKGSTKTIRKKYWAKGIRCVNSQLAIFAGLNGSQQDSNESNTIEGNDHADGNGSAGVAGDEEDDDDSDPRESHYNPSSHHGDRRTMKNVRQPSWKSSTDASADDSDVAVIADNGSSANSSVGDSTPSHTPSDSFHASDMAAAHNNSLHESQLMKDDFHASCASRMSRPQKGTKHYVSDMAVVHSFSSDEHSDFHASCASRMTRTKNANKHHASDMAVVHDNSLRSSQSTNENNGMDVIDEHHHDREADMQEDHNRSSANRMSRKMSSKRIIAADNPHLFSSDKAIVEGGSQCSTPSPSRTGNVPQTIDESERSGNTLGSGLKALLSLDFMGTFDNVNEGDKEVNNCKQSSPQKATALQKNNAIPPRRHSLQQEVNMDDHQLKSSANTSLSDGSSIKTVHHNQNHADNQKRRLSDTSKKQNHDGSKEDSPQRRGSQGSTSRASSFSSSFASYVPRRTSRGSENPSNQADSTNNPNMKQQRRGSAGRSTKTTTSFHVPHATHGVQQTNIARRQSNGSFQMPVPTKTNDGHSVQYTATKRRGSLDSLHMPVGQSKKASASFHSMSVPTKTNDGSVKKSSASFHSLGWGNNENIPLRATRRGSNSSFHGLTLDQLSKNKSKSKRRSSVDSVSSAGSNVSSFSALLREIYSPEYLAKVEGKMKRSTSASNDGSAGR